MLSTVTVFLLTTGVLPAQHEVSIYGATGYSRTDYSLNTVTVSPANGSTYSDGSKLQSGIGVGYTYSFTPNWGLVSGLELKRFNTTVEVKSLDDRIKTAHFYNGATEVMYLDTRLAGFNEKQTATMLQIPLLAEYRLLSNDEEFAWFVAAGAKVGFNVSGEYVTRVDRFVTSGYSPESGQTLFDKPEMGLVTHENAAWFGDLNYYFSVSLTAETGVRYAVTPRLGIYAGIYFDYGRAGIPVQSETGVVTYHAENPEMFVYNSILRSTQQSAGERFVDKIDLVSIGVKLRIGLQSKKRVRQSKADVNKE